MCLLYLFERSESKGTQRAPNGKKGFFVAVLSASPDTAGRGSAKLCFAQGDAPALRSEKGRSILFRFCYDCAVSRRERRKQRDQREDAFSERTQRVFCESFFDRS